MVTSTSRAQVAQPRRRKRFAVVGAGIAGISCARTLAQAGHEVTLIDKNEGVGGRTATQDSAFGTFDYGAQYFTVRDARFAQALQTVPGLCKPWSANTVRVLDELGRVAAAGLPSHEAHWVPQPGMAALASAWAQPLHKAGAVALQTRVVALQRDALDPKAWQLQTQGPGDSSGVLSGFDSVLLALPSSSAHSLLLISKQSAALARRLEAVQVAPCWAMMLAFPQAMQPNLTTLGPQWNAARSTHHRIAWLARESSKPGRGAIERWTVQASAAWSQEHLQDDEERVKSKLLKAFAEITGIRTEPAYVQTHRWLNAQTVAPLGQSHLLDRANGLGLCGDWCLGHRLENAFVSGLELALAAM